MKEEEELNIQREEAEKIKDDCERNLDQAAPELVAAISGIQQLSKLDLGELKTMRNPPEAVKILMEALCILLRVEPVKVKSKDFHGYIKNYWLASTGKQVLGNPRLVDILSKFEAQTLDAEIMERLEEVISNEEFQYENIARASRASKGLYLWVLALKNYYFIYKESEPKRAALALAQKQKIEKEALIGTKKNELLLLEHNLEILKENHKVKEEEIQSLQAQIE